MQKNNREVKLFVSEIGVRMRFVHKARKVVLSKLDVILEQKRAGCDG